MNAPRPAQPAATGAVASPCVNVCKMNETSGLCEGCLRTLDEIALWSRLSDDEKHEVWRRIAARRRSPADRDGR